MTKTGIIVQARMGSRRLPGKVLRPIAGKPMLQYTLERLRRGCPDQTIVVATSNSEQDTRIASFCTDHRFSCFRGPLDNVAARFLGAVQAFAFDAFVRISGDSPLLDQDLVRHAVELFRIHDCDLVTNLMPRTFPPGQSVEVVKTRSFMTAHDRMDAEEDFEHVTKVFYKNSADFEIVNFESAGDHRDLHMAVDRPEDMESVAAVIGKMTRPHWDYHLDEVVRMFRSIGTEALTTPYAA